MNVKDVNILEQHVEKIVLAVAAAGALWLGYLAIQPIEVAPGITASNLEDKASEAVAAMRATEEVNKIPKPDPQSPANRDYAADYRRIVNDQPLDPNQGNLRLPVPQIAPVNVAVRAGIVNAGVDTTKVIDPKPVAPELVTAEAWQQPIADVPTVPAGEQPQPPQPGTVLPTRDQNAVLIQGYIPVGRMQAEMDAVKNRLERLPDPLRKVSIYRIQVQRRERTATGFTDWKDVAPGKGTVPPTELDFKSDVPPEPTQSLALTEGEFKQIVLPDFHLDPTGVPNTPTIIKNPPRKDAADRLRQIQEEINRINSTAGPGGPAFRPGMTPAPVFRPGVVEEGMNEGAAPASPQLSADVAQIRSQPLLPFAFWDDNVETGHEYQYQVRVAFVNPTFKWPFGLKNPAMQNEPLLLSAWTIIPRPVVIHSDIAFFVMGGGGGKPPAQKLNFWVFKLTGGKWYRGDFEAYAGAPVTGTIRMVDQADKPLDVDTGYKLVDFTTDANGNVHAVLLDATGKLTTRDSAADRDDSEKNRLLESSVKRAAPPPKATTQPAPVVPMPGRGGRGGVDPRNQEF